MTSKELIDELDGLRSKRRSLMKQIDHLETEFIGIRLELDRRKESDAKLLESERGKERSELYDE